MKKNLGLFLFILVFLSTIVKADIKTGLVADFPFSGEPVVDVSGNNYRAAVHGATLTEDRFGNENSAYSFDWNQYIQTNVDGSKITDAMSISFWMKTNTSRIGYQTRSYLVTTFSSSGDGHYFSYYETNPNTDGLSTKILLYDNQWKHIVVTYDNQHIVFYLDGFESARKSVDSFQFKGGFFKFAKSRPSDPAAYRGALDDIKIYSRSLSENDVFELYNENKKPPVAITALSPKKTNPPTYIWNAIPNSSWYYLWVNDSSGNKIKHWYTASQAGCPNGIGICSVKPNTTLAKGSAVWWVRTWNDFGYGSWNKATRFNVSQ